MARVLLAHVLRGVVTVCLAVAIVVGVVTSAGLALAALGKLDLAGGHGTADLALTAGVALVALLSISRLAYIGLGHVVDLRRR